MKKPTDLLERFRFSLNRGNALSYCFHAIPGGKPVPTFPGIALAQEYFSAGTLAGPPYFDAAHRLARGIEAGQVFIDEHFAGGIQAPFGGTGKPGFGREKGFDAMKNYSRMKAVAARMGDR